MVFFELIAAHFFPLVRFTCNIHDLHCISMDLAMLIQGVFKVLSVALHVKA